FQFILTEIFNHVAKEDKDYWQAKYQAGVLLLEKYRRGGAHQAVPPGPENNPPAARGLAPPGHPPPPPLQAKGAAHFPQHAPYSAERALKITPKLPAALRLQADIQLAGGDVTAALKELEQARKVNPLDEHTLGRIAACLYLDKKQADYDALVKEVEKHDRA